MTNTQANELIAVVKSVLLPRINGHPEADDMVGEALLKAYQAVEAMPGDSPYRWTTIAGKAAIWQAREYLRQRRSGRLNTQREGDAVLPIPFSSLTPELVELAVDGGIKAADARLQLAIWQRLVIRQCRQCGGAIAPEKRQSVIYCAPACNWRAKDARRRQQKARAAPAERQDTR